MLCKKAETCLVTLWDDAGLFLKKKEFEISMLLAEKNLNSSEPLHKWALAKGRKPFNFVHKHHSFLRIAILPAAKPKDHNHILRRGFCRTYYLK